MELGTVTTSDLSRRPADVFGRVRRGERLLVVRHKDPVATLQPLDGYVLQPLTGTAHDVFGWPIAGVDDEIAKLSRAQQMMLRDCYRQWRLRPYRLPEGLWKGMSATLHDMTVRGLVKKTECGLELTARGLALHEALQGRVV